MRRTCWEPELGLLVFRYIPGCNITADEKSRSSDLKMPLKALEFHGHQGTATEYTPVGRGMSAQGQETAAPMRAGHPDYLLPPHRRASQISEYRRALKAW